jgi:hypothetical protein
MKPRSTIALSAAVVLFATFAAMAKDDNLPSIDLERACGTRAKTSAETMGDKSLAAAGAFDWCMNSEQKGRDALAIAWKDIPANYKAFCVSPNVYSPSYVEWISCVELRIDLKKAGQNNNNSSSNSLPLATKPRDAPHGAQRMPW